MTQNLAIGILSIAIGMTFSALGYLNGVSAAILHTISTLVIIMNSASLVREGEELEIAAKSSVNIVATRKRLCVGVPGWKEGFGSKH